MMLRFYKEQWHGSYDGCEEELQYLLDRAADVINNAIAFSGYTVDTVPNMFSGIVRKAVCAQADYIEANGGRTSLSEDGLNSAALGRFSYSTGSSDSSGSSSELCRLARNYLESTGLLYRGVDVI